METGCWWSGRLRRAAPLLAGVPQTLGPTSGDASPCWSVSLPKRNTLGEKSGDAETHTGARPRRQMASASRRVAASHQRTVTTLPPRPESSGASAVC